LKVDSAPIGGTFVDITETAGDLVMPEQVQRLTNRYHWASGYCAGKDVLEIACGTGPGLGLLVAAAKSVAAGDLCEDWIRVAEAQFRGRVDFHLLDVCHLPFPDASFDVLVFFEALYFIPDQNRAIAECRRVLRPGGHLLLATPNPDARDFHAYKYATGYLGVSQMGDLLARAGFTTQFFGDTPLARIDWRQRALRPVKLAVVKLGLTPPSKALKRAMKRMIYGNLQEFPHELKPESVQPVAPRRIESDAKDTAHRVILCCATVPFATPAR
jgi:SAM-dependent methyltransferase